MASAAMARAVKGGEAEASDVSAPSLEGPGNHPDHNGVGWPGTGRPGSPILGLATRSLPAWSEPERPWRRSTKRCKCVSPLWTLFSEVSTAKSERAKPAVLGRSFCSFLQADS